MKKERKVNLEQALFLSSELSRKTEKNYGNYKELHGISESAEADRSEAKTRINKPDMKGMRGLLGKHAARKVIRYADGVAGILDGYNSKTREAYAPESELSLRAYGEAQDRNPGSKLGSLVNKNRINFSELVNENIDESASIFDKLNLVRERAYEFAVLNGQNNRQYIIKDDTSTIVICNSSEYIPEHGIRGFGYGGGYSLDKSTAFKLSVMEADKSGEDKMVIDVYRFIESENYYYPVSKTTLLENDSATIERYDTHFAKYSAPKELSQDEVQSMCSHLILGDNILG